MRNRVFVLLLVNLHDHNPQTSTGAVEVYENVEALLEGIVGHKRLDLQTLYEENPETFPSNPEEWTTARVKGAWRKLLGGQLVYKYESVHITTKVTPRLPESRKPVMPRFASYARSTTPPKGGGSR